MIERVSRAAAMIAVLASLSPAWAEGPMTPLRRGAPTETPARTAQQWVEPPPAPKHAATENVVPGDEPEQIARPPRNSHQGRRVARARVRSTRDLNRQQLYGGWSGVSVPYYRGYGPAPYSNSGD